jgi:Tfp pilus assembly protein PilW
MSKTQHIAEHVRNPLGPGGAIGQTSPAHKKIARAQRPSRRARHGLGLAELLISLAISAALLTAVAFAIDAAFQSYKVNQEESSLTERARLALYRMLSNIRTTQAHQPYTPAMVTSFSTGQIVTDCGIKMYDDTNTQTTYLFDSPSQQLRVIRAGVSHILLNGVKSFTVKMEPMKSAQSVKTGSQTYDLLMRATILLTLDTNSSTSKSSETTGNQTVTLSSSVMPRRNIW